MPKFTVNFTVEKHHNNGAIEVEAESRDAAEEQVQQMDPEKLIEHTSGVEWTTDTWIDP